MTTTRPTSRFFVTGGTLPPDAAHVVRLVNERSCHATPPGEHRNVPALCRRGQASTQGTRDQKGLLLLMAIMMAAVITLAMMYFVTAPGRADDGNLVRNGSFEDGASDWTFTGEQPMSLVTTHTHDSRAIQLGEPMQAVTQPVGVARLHQKIGKIPSNWVQPVLTFDYRIHANCTYQYADFCVRICLTSTNCLTEMVRLSSNCQTWTRNTTSMITYRDGFHSCFDGAPEPGDSYDPGPKHQPYDTDWRTGYYDLSEFIGETVWLVFENKHVWPYRNGGIWTYVDDVRIVDAGRPSPPPGPQRIYLPIIMKRYNSCDPEPESDVASGSPRAARPPTPTPTPP